MAILGRGAEVLLPPLAVDRRAQKPLYRQVYEGFRDAILEGRIAVGGQLPSTRALAVELGISRLPVVLAFQLLVAEGYCEGRLGAGTFVSSAMRARSGSASGGAAPDSARRPVSR